MHSTEGLRRAPHRRPRIWKIVIIAVLIAAIGEPIVMYRMLVLQKEKRQAAAGLVIPAMAHKTASR
jgi:hypothetical protein